MDRRKVLIISYVFPPHPGIGGRRWAKFAKYLTRNGFEVHVVYAGYKGNNRSAWIHDIDGNENIILHPVKSFFPNSFRHPPRHFADRMIYKFWEIIAALQIRGYIYDRTVFSGKKFIACANQVITESGIKDVIVTGAPFRLVYLAARELKTKRDIRLLADFRDPWTWEHNGDYQKLPARSLRHEEACEAFVMQHADRVSVPTKNMKEHLEGKYENFKDKILLLPHAWDEDEIIKEEKVRIPVLKLVWFGTLYSGLEKPVRALARALKNTNGRIHLDIISDTQKYADVFKQENALSNVTYLPVMSSTKLYRRMKQYCASVIINNDSDKDHVSTKFIELAASGTPVIYIASPGKAGDFVRNKNLGWHIMPEEIEKLFSRIINKNCKPMAGSLDIKSLSFGNVTKQLILNGLSLQSVKTGPEEVRQPVTS